MPRIETFVHKGTLWITTALSSSTYSIWYISGNSPNLCHLSIQEPTHTTKDLFIGSYQLTQNYYFEWPETSFVKVSEVPDFMASPLSPNNNCTLVGMPSTNLTLVVFLLTLQIPEQQQLKEFVLWSTTSEVNVVHISKPVSKRFIYPWDKWSYQLIFQSTPGAVPFRKIANELKTQFL